MFEILVHQPGKIHVYLINIVVTFSLCFCGCLFLLSLLCFCLFVFLFICFSFFCCCSCCRRRIVYLLFLCVCVFFFNKLKKPRKFVINLSIDQPFGSRNVSLMKLVLGKKKRHCESLKRQPNVEVEIRSKLDASGWASVGFNLIFLACGSQIWKKMSK